MKKRLLSLSLALLLLAGMSFIHVDAASESPQRPAPKALNAAWFAARPSNAYSPELALLCAYVAKDTGSFAEEYGVTFDPAYNYEKIIWSDALDSMGIDFGLQQFEIGCKQLGKGAAWIVLKLGTTTSQFGTVLGGYLPGLGRMYQGYYAHPGYIDYADRVWEALEGFMAENEALLKGREIKLLVTGHSAGGSCANLLGVRLRNEGGVGGKAIRPGDTYVYGFESPPVYLGEPGCECGCPYTNIFNLVNTADVAALALPGQRFGRTYAFTCTEPTGQHVHNLGLADYEAGIKAGVAPAGDIWPRVWTTRDFWQGLMNLLLTGIGLG